MPDCDPEPKKAPNGSALDCYPEYDILHDQRLWKEITN